MKVQTFRTIRRSIKSTCVACEVVEIGAGKNVQIGLFGSSSVMVASVLENKGFKRSLLSGGGTDRIDMIVLDRQL